MFWDVLCLVSIVLWQGVIRGMVGCWIEREGGVEPPQSERMGEWLGIDMVLSA